MLDARVTGKYITNIPWSHNPATCFQDDMDKYEDAFNKVLPIIPESNGCINYYDDTWDFRPYYEGINSDTYIIRFLESSDDYIDYLKFFAIYGISTKSKISTVERRISDFIGVIKEIKSTSNHISFSLITTEDIIDCIESRDTGNSRKHSLYACVHLIYEFIFKNYHPVLSVDVNIFKEKSAYYKKHAKQDDRTPNIPEEYYMKIITKAEDVLNNPSVPYSLRMTAGMILIVSQTGLRRQDLLGIRITDLSEVTLPSKNVRCNYLHYQTRKPSKAHSDMLEFDIFSSPLCTYAFKKMLELRQSCIYKDEPYLYVLDNTNEFPVAEHIFAREYQRFFYKFLPEEIFKEWEGITKSKNQFIRDENNTSSPVYLSFPKLSQFRVHLATSLYNKGVSLAYIQRYLGHLSEYMIGYYVRPKSNVQENASYAAGIIKKIVKDDCTPLGLMGNELKKNLVKFVEDGEYNVATDIQSILDDLGDKLVIREKGAGLCCIKTSIIPCKNDARTNEALCAYGLCPNIFHFYDAIDATYMMFHALQDSYQINKENGHTRAAQKELNKLKDFIRRRLSPELNELERIVNKVGIDEFCIEHPDLKYIAKNIHEIKEEIALWEKY